MKNRVVAFVGDSLGREQFQSLMCMLTGGNDEAQVEDVSESYGLVKPPGAKRAEGTAQRLPQYYSTGQLPCVSSNPSIHLIDLLDSQCTSTSRPHSFKST